ncbi:glycosyltransferase family 4 protein [Mesonia sp.]|uniref:glycosyltransferase family 4 protein n=1 Tax=Mesonia sp. TaxID=1960830 RepID=UPI0017529B3D|nr:glycosyltransferase family 4 protein [Mesonia sp.]HIB38453.1 hypothetical protein [Mesonia sp.]
MKILFVISSDGGNAVGGHYNSLDQVSREVSKIHEVKIVSFGTTISPLIAKNPNFARHFQSKLNLLPLLKQKDNFSKFVKNFQPDIIHVFDAEALNCILFLDLFSKIPIVLNKCGGPNPKRKNYFHADAIVVFSKENQAWYLQNPNYEENDIFLIPNRVRKLEPLAEDQRLEIKPINKTTFLRVSRLGGAYEKTLLDSYNLIEKINKKNPAELIVVGRVQNKSRFDMLKQEAVKRNIPVRFITDERASRGSDFLYLADFVIGTGRSFMEAASLSKPCLTPAKNADEPILVDKQNFEHFFKTNFSERNFSDQDSLENNISKIESAIENKEDYKRLSEESKLIFDEYFGTQKIQEKYNSVYQYLQRKKLNRRKIILKNLPYLVKFSLNR